MPKNLLDHLSLCWGNKIKIDKITRYIYQSANWKTKLAKAQQESLLYSMVLYVTCIPCHQMRVQHVFGLKSKVLQGKGSQIAGVQRPVMGQSYR